MEDVVYINKTVKRSSQESEFAALAAQIEDSNTCNAIKQLITAAFAPHQPEAQQVL